MINHTEILCTDFVSAPTTLEAAKAIIADLQDLARGLEIMRQKHGIEFASDPIRRDEHSAAREIYEHWKDERCQSALQILRQFAASRQDSRSEWALQMVTAANRRAEEYRVLYEAEKRRAIALRDTLDERQLTDLDAKKS